MGCPFYCFHDRDVSPEGASSAEFRANLDALADDAAGCQEQTGVRLLWGTANLFTHPRYQAGAATNPDPDVFAYAAAQVKHMLEVTHRLGGRELRPVGRPRGIRHAAQHRPRAGRRPAGAVPPPRRGAQAPHRVQRPASDRTEADGADKAPVPGSTTSRPSTASSSVTGSTTSIGSTSRPITRRSPATASTTRSRSPSPTGSSAASTPTGATRRTVGTPTSSRIRSRIGVPHVRDPQLRWHRARRLQLRRQAAAPELSGIGTTCLGNW